jgi:hypothetical protein
MTIGNMTDAEHAAFHPSEYFLGSGISRVAFLINGVVYKVNRTHFNDNLTEYENIMRVRDMATDTIRFPEVAMYGDIIAMEYVEGTESGACVDCECGLECQYGDCMPADVITYLKSLSFNDICYGNVIEDCGRYYLIDAVS